MFVYPPSNFPMKRLPPFFYPCFLATLAIALIWLGKGVSDQELLANAAKAADFHPWSGWWSPTFLGGASQAPGLTTILTYLVLKPFLAIFGMILGAKLAVLIAVFLGGFGVAMFLREWTGSETAGWMGGVAYILGPQIAQRVAGNEHLPVVFSMVFTPWILLAVCRLHSSPTWRNSTILAMLGAGMALAFTKLAVVFAPVVLLFVAALVFRDGERRASFLIALGRAFLIFVPLAVIVLLPTLREMPWLALFRFDPFAAWQENFSLKSALSWLDRSNILQQGMPVGFTADQGGFYVGLVTLAVGLLAWRRSAMRMNAGHEADPLLTPLKTVFGMLLLVTWLSAGPRSIAQGMLEFLKNATGVADLTVPLFWVISVLQCVLLWKIWPDHSRRNVARIAALLVFLAVPGFRILEVLPFAHDIRAPWSVWQAGGSLAVALLFGIGGAVLCAPRQEGEKSSGALAALLVVLLAADYSSYLIRYAVGALPSGTYRDFTQTCAVLKQAPDTGVVYPVSGRYFYLQIPFLTGKPIEQEAFNSYFGLVWRRSLQNSCMTSAENIRAGLSLLGCGYLFMDKQDPSTPPEMQKGLRSLFPVLAEDEFFTVLSNPDSLYPGFLARDFVALPPGSHAMAPAALQLLGQNIITLELPGVDPSAPGYAGMARGTNQIELLESYRGHGGQPFGKVTPESCRHTGDAVTYSLPGQASGWLVSTVSYHPDWTVSLDGKPAQTRCAECALLSAYVPAGTREVAFRFEAPAWYSLCLRLGLLAWIAGFAAFFYLGSPRAPQPLRQAWTLQ